MPFNGSVPPHRRDRGRGAVAASVSRLCALSDFDCLVTDDNFHAEFDVLERMAQASQGHPLSLSLMQRDQSPEQWKWITERAEKANAAGTTIRLQVAPRPIGVLLGLEATAAVGTPRRPSA